MVWAPIVAALFVVGVSLLQMVVIGALAWATLAAIGIVRGRQAARTSRPTAAKQRATVPWEVASLLAGAGEEPNRVRLRRYRFRHHPDDDPAVVGEPRRSRAS